MRREPVLIPGWLRRRHTGFMLPLDVSVFFGSHRTSPVPYSDLKPRRPNMKSIRIALALSLLLAVAAVPAIASSSNIHTMAGILLHLNHFPSDSEKATLGAIAADAKASAAEKVLAHAMINLKHKVAASDAAALHELLTNPAAGNNERTLANILLSLAHHPSEQDKKKLQAMRE